MRRHTVKSAGRVEHVLLGAILRDLRNKAGLSQVELALRLGKNNNSYISKVEAGDQAIDIATIVDIVRITGGRLSEVMARLESDLEEQG